ncbi:hypothetical protein FSARC_13887 [Fusarium sarcochroum]|uniref:Uncharacterized protein n=1 Tax=Fusarium sarcochroum TaxID=1208366 RepID=A0A8H4WRN5_9HYPO|nr:hypothetical protein FSARC_13887 [Fusarium sarcochroum]
MSKQTTLGLGPAGLKHFYQSTVKDMVAKGRALMTELTDSLDKLKRGPVKTATEAGYTSETLEETREWNDKVDLAETFLQTEENNMQRLNELLDQSRQNLQNGDTTLDAADDLPDRDARKALITETLGWMLQEHPRIRQFVQSLNCEMTPQIEEALANMDLDDPDDSLAAQMSQAATQGPSRNELTERIASLEGELQTARDNAQAQSSLIGTLKKDNGELKGELSNQRTGEASLRKKMEERLEKADELRLNAEVAERAQNRETKQANLRTETAEQLVLDKDKELHEHQIQVKSLEGRQETLQRLLDVEKQRVKTLEQEAQRLKDDSQKQLDANESLRKDRDTWKGRADQGEIRIVNLEAQVGGGKAQLAEQQGDQRALASERDRAIEDLRKARQRADNNRDSALQWRQVSERHATTITTLELELETKLREKAEELDDLEEERDHVSSKLEASRKSVRDQKAKVEEWTKRCGRRDDTIGERDEQIEELDQELTDTKIDLKTKERQLEQQQEELDSTKARRDELQGECSRAKQSIKDLSKKVESQRSKLNKQKTNLEKLDEETQNQVSSLKDMEGSARTIAQLVMTECPSGNWQDILAQIDWNSPIVVADPTPKGWEVLDSWSSNDVLKVETRTDSLTTLFLLLILAVETKSVDGLVGYLVSIQLRLDSDSECILPVVRILLLSISKCLELPQIHAFQVFLLLQVAKRVGKAWPQVEGIVPTGNEHARVTSLCRAVEAWEQKKLQGDLEFEASLQYEDLALVGFCRKPNGILMFGERDLRWIDHDFVAIESATITLGVGEDSIELDPEGDGWDWWWKHIL